MSINWLEVADKIASILSSITLIIGSISLAISFKYKHDAETRNLYINNYKKVETVLKQIVGDGNCKNDELILLREAKNEAALYLPNQIFEYIDDLYIKTVDLIECDVRLRALQEGQERDRIYEKESELLRYFGEKIKDCHNVYRTQIVSEINFWEKYFPTFTRLFKFLKNNLCK